jgi:hypothetical protein
MITKKLAVPLINNKILQEAVHCYIATAAISEPAFDFVKSRLSPKCKIDIVTGLDVLTSPMVLRRIWRHYQDRITLNIYTKNVFRANVYIFDLPFRKSVAFIGSGDFTLEGLKDNEEIFWKILDPKDIEGLKSWFTGYFEFAEPLTEPILLEYELAYPAMKQREIITRRDKQLLISLTASGFSWDHIKFKNQYFKKEDYLVFSTVKTHVQDDKVLNAGADVQEKLLQLHALIKEQFARFDLHAVFNEENLRGDHVYFSSRSMQIAYGRSEAEVAAFSPMGKRNDFMTMEVLVLPKDVGLWLFINKVGGNNKDGIHLRDLLEQDEKKEAFFLMLTSLGADYWIEVAGDKKNLSLFQHGNALKDFIRMDQAFQFDVIIGKNYSPGDPALGAENIAATLIKEFQKLVGIYNFIKAPMK